MLPNYTTITGPYPIYRTRNGRKTVIGYRARAYNPAKRPRQKDLSLKTKDLAEAGRRVKEIQTLVTDGRLDPWEDAYDQQVSVREAADRYLAWEETEQHRTQSTIYNYKTTFDLFIDGLPARDKTLLAEVTDKDLKSFLTRPSRRCRYRVQQLAESTVAGRYARLAGFFRWAVEQKLINQNVLAEVKRPRRPDKAARWFTAAETIALVRAAEADMVLHPRMRGRRWFIDYVELAFLTLLRFSEIGELRWHHVQLSRRPAPGDAPDTVYGYLALRKKDGFRTKNGAEDILPISEGVARVLWRRHDARRDEDPSARVLTSATGRRIASGHANDVLRYYCRLAGISERTCHAFRHGGATAMLEAGEPSHNVQEAGRWKNAQMLDRYSHATRLGVRRSMQALHNQLEQARQAPRVYQNSSTRNESM